MMIVFFHVIYLIGKMVYEKYRCSKLSDGIESKTITETSHKAPVIVEVAKNQANKYYDPFDDLFDDEAPPKPLIFSPPAYIQRYISVIEVLTEPRYRGKIKKVVDFGCSELSFVAHLKNTPGIEEIVCVDVDRDTLESHKEKAIPLNADYLRNRQHPLTIHVYEGSVTDRDKVLANSDAVVAIELIEHLYPETLMEFPYNVFGFIKPLVAVVTTPNADFNVLFPNMKTQFRHWDHKFEWTRQQFADWSSNIVSRYPDYEVTLEGVCPGPLGTEKYGCCSQMAIFRRVRDSPPTHIYAQEGLLKIVTSQEYPYRVDNRSDEEKILDEVSYHIRQYANNNPEGSVEYPLASLMLNLANFCVTMEGLREILVNGNWTIIDREEGPMVQCPELSTFSDYDTEVDVIDDSFMDQSVHFENTYEGWQESNIESAYDDDNWDNEYDAIVHAEISDEISVDELASNFRVPLVEYATNWTRSIDIDDLKCMEIVNAEIASTIVSDPDENSSLAGNTSERPTSRITRLDRNSHETGELGSLCSIFLESSRNDETDACPRDITNSSFDCTELQRSFEDEKKRDRELPDLGRRLLAGIGPLEEPRSSSSPRVPLVLREPFVEPLASDASRTTNACIVTHRPEDNEKLGPAGCETYDATIPGNDVVVLNNEETPRNAALKTPASLRLRNPSDDSRTITRNQETPNTSNDFELSRNGPEAMRNATSDVIRDEESSLRVAIVKDNKDSRSNGDKAEVVATSPETPPGSWSPEIIDSGYPNTSSIQDTTPEFDLSSIAQDKISDSESPSVAEVPQVFLEPVVHVDEVQNGDLANNNRDDEGNNVAADQYDPEDLQPLIDVLENDLENENDIYVLENDFPLWLLRILERGHPRPPQLVDGNNLLDVRLNANVPGRQPGIVEPNYDEGYDNTSSDNDEDYDEDDYDDDDNDDDDDDDDDDDNDDDDDDDDDDEEDDDDDDNDDEDGDDDDIADGNVDGEDEHGNVEGEDNTDWNMSEYQR